MLVQRATDSKGQKVCRENVNDVLTDELVSAIIEDPDGRSALTGGTLVGQSCSIIRTRYREGE
jgi:hypothetical protein